MDAYEIDLRTGESASQMQGTAGAPKQNCRHWVRVSGHYADRWHTPMAGAEFRLWINDAVVLERERLKDHESLGLTRGRKPADEAQRKLYDEELGSFLYQGCPVGKARAEILRDPSAEADVKELRDALNARLDGAYRGLKDKMAPYQAQWDRLGYLAIVQAYNDGLSDSAVEWWHGLGDLFTTQYWVDIGEGLRDGAVKVADTAQASFKDATKRIEYMYDHADRLADRAWWGAQVDETVQSVQAVAEKTAALVQEGADVMQRGARAAQAVYRHRDAILALPDRVVAGDVDGIEQFIDTVLADIDPAMADSLRHDARWQSSIELLQDGEAASIFCVYFDLFLAVVPPNFWAHAFGRAAFYVLVEVVLLVIGALLGGAGAAARISMISARLARMGGTMARIGKLADKILDAVRAAQRMIDALVDSITDLEKIKAKLLRARRRSLQRGHTGQTLHHRRDTEDRDGRCRVCGSKTHHTPLHRHGQVDYV
jgi:hypothetical protein